MAETVSAQLAPTRRQVALESYPSKTPLSSRDMLPIPGNVRLSSHIEQVRDSRIIVPIHDALSVVFAFRPGRHGDGKLA
jgi:predicted N-formylglutamate amidohydrolase